METTASDLLNEKVLGVVASGAVDAPISESLVAAWAEIRASVANAERAVWAFALTLQARRHFSMIHLLATDVAKSPTALSAALATDLFALVRDYDSALATANALRSKFPLSPHGNRVYVKLLIALGRNEEAGEILRGLSQSVAQSKWAIAALKTLTTAAASTPTLPTAPIDLAVSVRDPSSVAQQRRNDAAPIRLIAVPAEAVPLFVFLHVPKTAGTTFRWILMNMFGSFYHLLSDEIYQPGHVAIAAAWTKPDFFDDKLAIAGHIERDHRIIKAIQGRRVIFVSLMRDPVDRVVSLYDYLRTRKVHPMNKWLCSKSLLEAVTEPGKFQDECINYQLRAILGRIGSENCDSELDAQNYIIGKSENVPALTNAVSAISGMKAPGATPVFNTKADNRQAIVDADRLSSAREQSDFDEAVAEIKSANKNEYKLFNRIGDSVLTSFLLTPAGTC